MELTPSEAEALLKLSARQMIGIVTLERVVEEQKRKIEWWEQEDARRTAAKHEEEPF